jgi:hypothetical protein
MKAIFFHIVIVRPILGLHSPKDLSYLAIQSFDYEHNLMEAIFFHIVNPILGLLGLTDLDYSSL